LRMTIFHYITKAKYRLPEWRQAFGGASVAILLTGGAAVAADLAYKAPPSAASALYDWTGFYAGVSTGYAFGNSNWSTSGSSGTDHGSLNLSQGYDGSNQGGSWFNGLQIGYNRMLANRVVIGVEADANASSFNNYAGNRIGNTIPVLPTIPGGAATYSDNVFASGTVRGRIGYAPGNWLFYATGGFAWTHEQYVLTDNGVPTATRNSTFQQRVGWAAGVGVEGPLIPHWTVKAEYLYTGFDNRNINFPSFGQQFTSNLSEQEVRVGVNYHFGEKDTPNSANFGFDPDKVNIHGQVTYTWQGYPAFKQKPGSIIDTQPPFLGFPNGGEARAVGEGTLYLGYRLWKGAEFWINPEIDQGSGVANNLGVGAYPNAEAFKVGSSQPYAKVQRAFVRQTINLGGETQTVAADINQFAATQTSDRLVFTFGRMSPLDVFDTNKYANNAKTQFFNWGFLYGLPFDWGGDAWGYGWGATAEWYQGRFTYRLGYFDTEKSAIADNTPTSTDFGVDPTFRQYNIISEIEERHQLWGQDGKVKLNVNVIGANLGSYTDAITNALANANNLTSCAVMTNFGANAPALSCVRKYTTKVDVHLNIEQAITPDIGVFSRIGLAPSYVEDLAVTDGNFFASGGASFSGNLWGRPTDTIGIGYIYNKISNKEQQYLNFGGPGSPANQQLIGGVGGLGSFVGDGQLANLRAEQVLEAYYSWQLTPSTAFTVDYQFFANPGFNGDRGPINLFATRIHSQF
jgi:high affinity Mn2+ porin